MDYETFIIYAEEIKMLMKELSLEEMLLFKKIYSKFIENRKKVSNAIDKRIEELCPIS